MGRGGLRVSSRAAAIDGADHANSLLYHLHRYGSAILEHIRNGHRISVVSSIGRRRYELRLHLATAMRGRRILRSKSILHGNEFNVWFNVGSAETAPLNKR